MKMPRPRRMSSTGHYRAPRLRLPGGMNMPRVGRVGKVLPSPAKMGVKLPRLPNLGGKR